MEYDWREDSYKSWLLAIREIRLKGVREGRFKPNNDEERAIARGGVRALTEADIRAVLDGTFMEYLRADDDFIPRRVAS